MDVEDAFLRAALEIGLAEKIAAMSAEVACDLVALPAWDARARARLEKQQHALQNPNLRTIAAIVRGLCPEETARATRMNQAFQALAARHPDLSDLASRIQALAQEAAPVRLSA